MHRHSLASLGRHVFYSGEGHTRFGLNDPGAAYGLTSSNPIEQPNEGGLGRRELEQPGPGLRQQAQPAPGLCGFLRWDSPEDRPTYLVQTWG